ncbi:MAG: terminase family protein [Candidatus Gracilibacteria bacterium]|nr:terminase family protein [Candidatus Gracilibacteria bacterium]
MERNLLQESLNYLLSLSQDQSDPNNLFSILKDPKQHDKLFQVINIIDPKYVKDIEKDIYGMDFRNKKNRKVIDGNAEIAYDNIHHLINWGCSKDINYFANYFRIVTVDDGLTEIPMRQWQIDSIQDFIKYPFNILNCARQVGKSTSVSLYVSWKFNYRSFNNSAILANKYRTAKLLLHRIRTGYEHLPFFIQQPMDVYNIGELRGINGSRIFATATTEDSISGESVNDLIIDEVAKILPSKWKPFWTATLPVISSAKRKESISVILLSTPLGDNHWKGLVENARLGESSPNWNGFHLKEVTYLDIPEKANEEFKKDQISKNSEEYFMQEYEAKFVTQKDIFFTSTVLDSIVVKNVIRDSYIQDKFKDYKDNISIYEKPLPNHRYVVSFDPSEMMKGSKKNEHTNFGIQIVDVTDMRQKWRQVLSVNFEEDFDYLQSPMLLVFLAKYYNCAWIIGENNKCKQILNDIKRDYDYEFVFKGKKDELGYRTTSSNKGEHAKLLKILVDRGILEINDDDTLFEMKKFSKQLKAQSSYSDGLVLSMMGVAMLLNLSPDRLEELFGTEEEGVFIKRGKELLQLSADAYVEKNDIEGVIYSVTDQDEIVQEILEKNGFFNNKENNEDEDFIVV